MIEPQPLQSFTNILLKSKAIKKLVTEHYGAEARQRMKQFRVGEIDDLVELIEINKLQLAESPVETLQGAAPDNDVFHIELCAVGPVFYIRANEFDDIGYFSSLKKARIYAESEFEGFISELAERGQDEEDSEESLDVESSESEDEKAWFKQHLSTGTCPVCRAPQSQCNHLLADIDLTFGSFDSGSLNAVYVEICEFEEKTGGSNEDGGPLMGLYDFLLDNVIDCYHSDGSENLGRPMSESRNVWFWSRNVAGVEKEVREYFLPATPPKKPKKQSRKRSAP
jgi:hypothetical protein